jgi:hypothetical protein
MVLKPKIMSLNFDCVIYPQFQLNIQLVEGGDLTRGLLIDHFVLVEFFNKFLFIPKKKKKKKDLSH